MRWAGQGMAQPVISVGEFVDEPSLIVTYQTQ